MSEFRIDQIKSQDATRGPDVAGITTFTGTSGIVMPSGDTAYRGGRGRGVIMGGTNPGSTNEIEYVTISTLGNATDFGDLTSAVKHTGCCASSTRGIRGGGWGNTNTIDFVTITSTGNAFDFGELSTTTSAHGACSSSTRGLFGGGLSPSVYLDTISYITMASKGDSSLFGDLTKARAYMTSGVSNGTRGVFAGGYIPGGTKQNTIDYVTISTLGNAADFGDMTVARDGLAGLSNEIRGVWGGGVAPTYSNIINYITITSTGDAIDFGDLSVTRGYFNAGCASATRGLFCGGYDNPSPLTRTATIDYITIMSVGNAADFGDLLNDRGGAGACSDSHGGLG